MVVAPRRSLARLISALVLSALLLGACSLVDIAYHQLDWLMLRQVESVVDLNNAQRARLRRDIDALLQWHCETQLPRYVAFLTELERDFRRGDMTAARVAEHAETLEGYWYAVLGKSTDGLGRLLAGLAPYQVDQLELALRTRNEETARAIRSAADQDPSKDYANLAQRQIRRWIGPLNPRQQRIIREWSRDFEPLGQLGLAYRRQLHRRLHQLILTNEGDPAGLTIKLRGFIDGIKNAPPPDYAARVDANKVRSIEMIARVVAAADAEQLDHLSGAIDKWRGELRRIRCD
jgi:hypothetical protein